MDPVQSAVAAFLSAIQAGQGLPDLPANPQAALSALLGQDVTLLFQGLGPGGLQFTLPSGQTVTAQGDFPFPQGTQVLARVSTTGDGGGIRLQTLQAQPPAPAAILAPLLQGEGLLLEARLTQSAPPSELVPLVQLFQALGGLPAVRADATAGPATPAAAQTAASAAPGTPAPATTAGGSPATSAPAAAQAANTAPAASPAATPLASGSSSPATPTTTSQAGVSPPAAGLPNGITPAAGLPASTRATASQGAGTPPAIDPTAGTTATSGQTSVMTPAVTLPASATPAGGLPVPAPQPAGSPAAPRLSATAPTGDQPSAASPAARPATMLVSPLAPPVPGLPQAAPASGLQDPAAPLPGGSGTPAAGPPDPGAAAPPPALQDLAGQLRALPAPGSLPSAEALQTLLKDLPEAQVQALGRLLRGDRPEPAQVQDAIARLQTALAHHPELPPGQGDALVQLLRNLVRAPDQTTSRTPQAAATTSGPSAAAHAAAAAPESWESWIRAGVKALTDPAVSPREAPFHAAQAREGTGFFELPLPWSPQSPLQLWVEADRQGRNRPGQDGRTTRVLLGMAFSNLGETRLGLAKGPEGLQVRVWAQNTGPLVQAQAGMEEELRALGIPVDLKILPLEPGPGGTVPSIRSLAAGTTFQVLG